MKTNIQNGQGNMEFDDAILTIIALKRLIKKTNVHYKDAIVSLIRKILGRHDLELEEEILKSDDSSSIPGNGDLSDLITLKIIQSAIQNRSRLRITLSSGSDRNHELEIALPALKFSRQWLITDKHSQNNFCIPITDIKRAYLC